MTDAQRGKIKVQIDRHGDVSKFATVTEVKQRKEVTNEDSKDLRDDVLAVTNGSYETRMTSVEDKLGDFGTKLDINTANLQKSIDLIIKKIDMGLQGKPLAGNQIDATQHFSPAENSSGSKRSAESVDGEDGDVHRQELQGRLRSKRILIPNQVHSGTAASTEVQTVSKPGEAASSSGTT